MYSGSTGLNPIPASSALYSRQRRNSDHAASEMLFDKRRFFCIFFASNFSVATKPYLLTTFRASWWTKLCRLLRIRSCTLATVLRAFSRFFGDAFFTLSHLRCALASAFSSLRKKRGLAIFSLSENTAKLSSPTSMPTAGSASVFQARRLYHKR